jgi:hypothetical protein
LSLASGCTFPELQENLLNPLTTLFFTSTTLGKARFLECFTAIVKRWTTYDWPNWANFDAPPPFRLGMAQSLSSLYIRSYRDVVIVTAISQK